ncbi:cytochrome c oxidase subunit 1 [Rhizophlyctis rosea]|nr:cytochrome c oxidase subunit 1 [Rhizophlyctis rosea]
MGLLICRQEQLDPSATNVLAKLETSAEALISNLDSLLKRFMEIDAAQKEALAAIGAPPSIERMGSITSTSTLKLTSDGDNQEAESAPPILAPHPQHPHAFRLLNHQQSTDSISSDTSNLSSIDLLALMKNDPSRASLVPELNTLSFTLNRNRLSGDQQGLLAGTPTSAPSPASSMGAATPTTPKMFSKLPPEVLAANLQKNELMRLSAVYELIETEADYVKDLRTMINYHQEEIKKTNLLSNDDILTLFSNIDQLVPVNQHLLERLQEKRDTDPLIPEVGDALVDVSESFKVYTQYCGNYPTAMKLLYALQVRPDFKEHLQKWMNSTEGRGLSLESFLIKPVQRICKYPLLIRELQKHTDKLSKDTISLNLAMEKIEAVVSEVNEGTRQLGERERLTTLEKKIETPMPLYLGTLRHVRDGVVQRVQAGKTRERYILVFAEALLLLKLLKGGKYQAEAVYDMGELVIKPDGKGDAIDAIPRGVRNAWQVLAVGERKDTFVFSTSSEEDRDKWVEAFVKAIKLANTPDREGRKPSTVGASMEKQFNDVLDGKGTIRFMSGTIGGRKSAAHSRQSSGGSLRSKAWGGSVRKKGVDFANENLILETANNLSDAELPIEEPDMVEANGQVWKRTPSAMGISYYYNPQTKETAWRPPEGYITLDPSTGKPFTVEDELPLDEEDDLLDEQDMEEEMTIDQQVDLVEGYPDWRKVERDGVVYWCNVVTMESRWEPPGPGEEGSQASNGGGEGGAV